MKSTRSVFFDEAGPGAIDTGSASGDAGIIAAASDACGRGPPGRGTHGVFFRHSAVIAKVTGSASGGNSKTATTSKVSGHGPPKNHRVFAKSYTHPNPW